MSSEAHRESWDLLPWLVNERLPAAQRARVEEHLRDCALCRDELEAQRDLCKRITADERIAYSPSAAFEKLWTRIEDVEREEGGPGADLQPDVHRNADDVAPSGTRTRPWTRAVPALSRWLVAAVIVQAVALSWIAYGLLVDRADLEWRYRTVTSPLPNAGGAAATLRVRVVFDREVPVHELQRIVAAHGLVIVHGPSSSQVFTLEPVNQQSSVDPTRLLEHLRSEPAIRFAEVATGTDRPAPRGEP
jgi:hypothetical protein